MVRWVLADSLPWQLFFPLAALFRYSVPCSSSDFPFLPAAPVPVPFRLSRLRICFSSPPTLPFPSRLYFSSVFPAYAPPFHFPASLPLPFPIYRSRSRFPFPLPSLFPLAFLPPNTRSPRRSCLSSDEKARKSLTKHCMKILCNVRDGWTNNHACEHIGCRICGGVSGTGL